VHGVSDNHILTNKISARSISSTAKFQLDHLRTTIDRDVLVPRGGQVVDALDIFPVELAREVVAVAVMAAVLSVNGLMVVRKGNLRQNEMQTRCFNKTEQPV
jgi:hypothetical protein